MAVQTKQKAGRRWSQKPWILIVRAWNHWSIRSIVAVLAGYSVLQGPFGLPTMFDGARLLSGRSWDVEVGASRLWGNVQLLSSQAGSDSLVAWAESEGSLPITITNRISKSLRIDSVKVYDGELGTDLGYQWTVEEGEYRSIGDSYLLEGERDIKLSLQPLSPKGHTRLLQSFLHGTQSIRIFTDRGVLRDHIRSYSVKDREGKPLKEIWVNQ